VDLVGDGGGEFFEECLGGHRRGTWDESDEGELAGAVDGDEQVELAFGGTGLGDVDVEVADGVGLELLAGGVVAFHFGQAADAVASEAAVQG
jgi:hypothetical protein